MAAAISGVFPVCLEQQQACAAEGEDIMKKQQVALMERLRSKRSSPHRSWTDSLMKSIRTTVVDRRLQADTSERNQVQKCLDTLQRAMKVISQQSLVERLELVARQQELTFHFSGNDQPNVTLKADMFHIEIILNKGGGVKEVKVAHQGDASNVCHELTDILCRGDFAEFTSHLEGLQSIYGVTGEKKLKSKAFLALQSLEKDLNYVAEFQNSISGVANYIHKSPLGILLPRTAGKPMKLIYFVSPYDLLDKKTHTVRSMTIETITEHGLGRSVTVCLEPGPSTKLQIMPLMSINKISDGNCLPSFNGLTHSNSVSLPARFVLVLPQPIPVAMSVMQKIQNITQLDAGKEMGSQPLLSLILDSNSDGKIKKDQQLFVSLPDQHHRYFINGVSGGLLDEPGVMLSRIPFNHPTHVAKILIVLRQQLLFNSILASCVRPSAKKDPASSLVFEMTVISLTQIMVVFEHPAYDTMITVDIDVSDITNLKCRLQSTTAEHNLCSDEYASQVLQRCLSLPVLLRALIRKGRDQLEKLMAEAKALAEEQARRAQEAAMWAAAQLRQQQQQARYPPNIPTKGRPPPPQPPPPQLTPTYPPTPSPVTSNPPSVGGLSADLRGIAGRMDLLDTSPPGYPVMMGPGGDSQDKQSNPLLVTLLDNEQGHPNSALAMAQSLQQQQGTMPVTESPMLSRLLDDNISVATNINPISVSHGGLQQPQPQPKAKSSKGRKRRSQSDMPAGRSPKHRVSDSDTNERSFDLESSSSPFESSLGGSGGLTGFHHQMGPTPPRPPSQGHMSSVIDLTDESMPESNLKKLVSSMEGFMPPKDIKPGGATPDSELQALLSKQDHTSSPAAGLKPNQVTGPKNENASTSPEVLLIGSGEVGKASLPDPAAVHPRVQTPSRSSPPTSLAAFLGHGQAASKARRDSNVGLHQQLGGPFTHQQDVNTIAPHFTNMSSVSTGMSSASATTVIPRPKVVSSSSMTEMLDVKPTPPSGKRASGLKSSASTDSVMDKRGLFEKFDFTGQTVSSTHVTITSSSVPVISSVVDGEDHMAPRVRLKLHPFRAPHSKSQSLDSGVVQSPSSAGSKSSNSNTFDFRSDEDDDESVPMNYVPKERLSVYSQSPTRLQISSKGKPPTPVSTPDSPPPVKPEKYKRKDKSSGNTKRKKDRDESKKERKKKKFDHDRYVPTGKEPVYRASTIESDQKTGTKLKIRVSKEPIKMPSPVKESSRVDMTSEKVGKFSEKVNDILRKRSTPSSPVVEKLVLHKQDIKDHHATGDDGSRDIAHVYRSSSLSSSGKSSQKSSSSGKGGISSSNSLSKDPKLAKATIRLKPLNITSTTSTSVTLTSSLKTTSSGRSASERSERRNQSLSASTPVSTPTSGALSLSAILPNAPTASKVASLPPIPKIAKASVTSSTTTTSTSNTTAKSGMGVANTKNSTVNSGFNNTVNNKVSGNPGMGGSRPGSNMPNALKSPNMSFNKGGGPGGIQKTSPNMAGHKTSGNSNMPPGILKNSGNVSQSGTNSQKISVAGNQGIQKGSTGPNQISNSYNRGPNSANQAVGPQKSALSGQGVMKNVSNQGMSAHKSSGVQGGIVRGATSGNQGLQKNPGVNQGGVQKSSSVSNQGVLTKMSGSPNQNIGPHKTGLQGKATSSNAASSVHRNLSQGGNMSQKNLTQSSNSGSKLQGSTVSNSAGGQGQNQKLTGNQGRSLSTGGHNSSPNSSGRNAGSGRNSRTPPNHLAINRSMSAPGQKASSGSSPRTPAGHSPSNPSAPRFPSNSPQQKNSGASPSSVSQRSGNTSQAANQRSNSSQPSSNQRSTSNSSQRSSSSPQTQRSVSNNQGSSPNQRPASTPGPATDPRLSSGGVNHTPGYPVRPSSAGPRQSSSPSSSKPVSASGQSSTSSPSGSRTSSPGGQGQRSSGASTVISPLVSHQSSNGGAADTVPLSRENPSGSLNPSAVSRHSTGNSSVSTTVSRQNSNSGTMVVSRQNSSSDLTAPAASQSSGTSSSTPAVSRQNSSGNLSSSAVSRQNLNNNGGSGNSSLSSGAKPSSNSSLSSAPPSSISSHSSVSAVTSQQTNAQSGTLPTSGQQLSSGSTIPSNTFVTASRTSSGAVIASAQRTSSGSGIANLSANKVGGAGNKAGVNKTVLSGAIRTKTTSGLGGSGDNGAMGKGANASRMNTTTTTSSPVKTTSVGRTPSVGSASAMTNSSSGSVGSSGIATGPKTQSTLSTSSTKSSSSSSTSTTLSSVSLSSAPAATVSATSTCSKGVVAGAARGRKGSLSAIVDKLATRMSASSGPGLDCGDSSGSGRGTPPTGGVSKTAEVVPERRKSAVEEGNGAEIRAGVKRSASVSGLSPPNSDQKLQRLESHGKSTSCTIPSPAHTTCSIASSLSSTVALSAVERRRSGSLGESTSPLQQKDLGEVGLDLSMPKDRARLESITGQLPPPRPDSRGQASPKESNPVRSGSPAVGIDKPISGTKFNGDSSKDKLRSENEMFKVPTPKTQSCEEIEERSSGGGSGGRSVSAGPACSVNSRLLPAPTSPLSDASSPENELIIDCEESPSLANSRPLSSSRAAPVTSVHPSPKRVSELVSEGVVTSSISRTSPSTSSGKASPSSNACSGKNSPQPSPHPKPSPGRTSLSPAPNDAGVNSPCEIDDDLMDAALMGFNAS